MQLSAMRWPVLALLAASRAEQPRLREPLFVGIEPVANAGPLRPDLSARLLADLSAMPNVRVVDIGVPRNGWDFASLQANKLRLFSVVEFGPFCLRASYTVYISGQQQYASGLVIPREQASGEAACIDLYATRLYGDLIRQGL